MKPVTRLPPRHWALVRTASKQKFAPSHLNPGSRKPHKSVKQKEELLALNVAIHTHPLEGCCSRQDMATERMASNSNVTKEHAAFHQLGIDFDFIITIDPQ
jgi:hypothetical protein